MDVSKHLKLHPRQVARPLHDIEGWRLPETEDSLSLQRGVSQMLGAMKSLGELQVPVEVAADGRDDSDSDLGEGETLYSLLGAAEEALNGDPHRLRIQRVATRSPDHAAQLERARRHAVNNLRSLRLRLDFICEGLDSLEEPARIRERASANRLLQ